jgi:hypothetical protein
MSLYKKILVQFDNHVGSFIASEFKLVDDKLIECDGRIIDRSDYQELFEYYRFADDKFKIPDYRYLINKQIRFYLIAKS